MLTFVVLLNSNIFFFLFKSDSLRFFWKKALIYLENIVHKKLQMQCSCLMLKHILEEMFKLFALVGYKATHLQLLY